MNAAIVSSVTSQGELFVWLQNHPFRRHNRKKQNTKLLMSKQTVMSTGTIYNLSKVALSLKVHDKT